MKEKKKIKKKQRRKKEQKTRNTHKSFGWDKKEGEGIFTFFILKFY